MSIAALIRRMSEAGATPEAIALAVEAIEAIAAKDEERKAKQRERTAKSRAKARERDGNVTVTSRSHVGNDAPPCSPPNTPTPPNTPPIIPPVSDADASARPEGRAPEVSINDQIWNSKVALADLSGKSEAAVGRWIGKALKDHPPDVVKQGIDAALHAGTRDPFSYARSVMLNSRGARNDQQATRNGRTYPAAQPAGTTSRLAAIMGYDTEPDLHGPAEERRVSDRSAWPQGRHASGFLDAEPDAAGVYRA